MDWIESLAPEELEQARAAAQVKKQAAEEVLSIALERLAWARDDDQTFTGARLAKVFLVAAFTASQHTEVPMPWHEYAAAVRAHADAAERHGRTVETGRQRLRMQWRMLGFFEDPTST